jgi:hypothetical protein
LHHLAVETRDRLHRELLAPAKEFQQATLYRVRVQISAHQAQSQRAYAVLMQRKLRNGETDWETRWKTLRKPMVCVSGLQS